MAKLLVVDDDASYRQVFTDFLRGHGHDVEAAWDEVAAIAALRRPDARFDAILVDMVMGHGRDEGLNVIREARKLDRTNQTLVVTGFGTTENCAEALKVGAFAYVEKGAQATLDLLLTQIERACNYRALLQRVGKVCGSLEAIVQEASTALEALELLIARLKK